MAKQITFLNLIISILQTFRFWVATSSSPAYGVFSNDPSYTPEFAPVMNVLLWGMCDF